MISARWPAHPSCRTLQRPWPRQFSSPAQPSSSSSKPSANVQTKCSKCETLVGPGKSHKCSKETRIGNITNIIKSSSKRTRHKILKEGLFTEFDEVMNENNVELH